MFRKNIIFVLLLSVVFLLASCVPAAYKKGLELDGDYPDKDLPLYDDAIIFESEAEDGEIEISYGVKDGDVDDVMDFYQDYFEEEGIILAKEKEEKDEYSAKGTYEDFEFEINVEEAKGKYEEKVFETVVEVEIEFIDEDDATVSKDKENSDSDNEDDGYLDSDDEKSSDEKADPEQTVEIPDVELEKLVRDAIGVAEGAITVSDMELLDGLSIKYEEYPVYDLTGLEYAVNMYSISYFGGSGEGGSVKSLAPLANLPLLEYMNVSYSTVEQAPPAFNTPLLARASFIDINITDFAFLSSCTAMTNLTVDDCGITSIDFVRNMENLESLNAEYNSIKDISPVEGKTKLKRITLQQNEITDISVLSGCTSLESVIISYNYITTLSPLYGLANLTEVRAYEEIGKKKIDQGSIDDLIGAGVEVYYHR